MSIQEPTVRKRLTEIEVVKDSISDNVLTLVKILTKKVSRTTLKINGGEVDVNLNWEDTRKTLDEFAGKYDFDELTHNPTNIYSRIKLTALADELKYKNMQLNKRLKQQDEARANNSGFIAGWYRNVLNNHTYDKPVLPRGQVKKFISKFMAMNYKSAYYRVATERYVYSNVCYVPVEALPPQLLLLIENNIPETILTFKKFKGKLNFIAVHPRDVDMMVDLDSDLNQALIDVEDTRLSYNRLADVLNKNIANGGKKAPILIKDLNAPALILKHIKNKPYEHI